MLININIPDGASGEFTFNTDTGEVVAFGSNANNLAKGLQIGGGDESYGADGTLLNADGHASWLRMQPSKNESNVELLLYSSSSQGRATATTGTSTITRISGTEFTAAWIGKKFYFGSAIYKVASFIDVNNITVTNLLSGVVPFVSTYTETFHVSYICGTGTCTVAGGVASRISGDPFIPFITAPYVFKLNGAVYAVSSFADISTQTLSAPPSDGTYSYQFETDINDQLATFRVQKMRGTDEENLSCYARYDGYHLRSFFAGAGQLRPIFMGSSSFTNMAMYPDGTTSLGSVAGSEAIRILPTVGTPANRIEAKAALPGLTPTLRARGTDTNVGFGFDTQGSGNVSFTSQIFSKMEFQVFGVGGSSWLAVQSDNFGAPTLSANGASAAIDIKLAPKGAGAVWLGAYTAGAQTPTGFITVKDSSGVIRKIPCM